VPRIYEKKRQALNLSERLNELEDFKLLPESHRQIALEHVTFPGNSKEVIARKLGMTKQEVYAFFHTKAWEVINLELARQQMRELIQLACKTLRDCMVESHSGVKLQAAQAVLANAHILEQRPKSLRQDNKMVIVWGNEGDKVLNRLNADNNPVYPASETAGDTRLAS